MHKPALIGAGKTEKNTNFFIINHKCNYASSSQPLWSQILSPFIVKEEKRKHLFTCMLINQNLYGRLELYNIPSLNCSTTPYILDMMQPAPERPRMLRRRAHASLHRTTLSRAATIMNLPCQWWWHKPSSMHHQPFSVHKRNSRVTHWFFFVLS